MNFIVFNDCDLDTYESYPFTIWALMCHKHVVQGTPTAPVTIATEEIA